MKILIHILKIASFVILLSHAEGFPTVFVEGLSLGTGFVSTPVGGTKELSMGENVALYHLIILNLKNI